MPLPNETIIEFYEGTNPLNYDTLDGPSLNAPLAQLLANDVYLQGEIDTLNAAISNPYQGDYDADSNSPDLDSSPIADIKNGDYWDVTVAGTFFTIDVEVGDVVRAKQDNPTLETHWTVIQGNTTPSSIKTQYESNSNTNAFTDAYKANLDFAQNDVLYVDLAGNDANDGSVDSPFLTIGAAIAAATALTPASDNRILIKLGVGEFTEDPFTIPQFVSIVGDNDSTELLTSNAALDFITMESNSSISHCRVGGVTGSGKYCINVSGTAAGRSDIEKVIVGSTTISGGIKTSCSVSGLSVVIRNTSVLSFTEKSILAGSNTVTTLVLTGHFTTGPTSTGIESEGDAELTMSSVRVNGANKGYVHGSSGVQRAILLTITDSDIPFEQNGSGSLEFRSSSLDLGLCDVNDWSKITGAIYNTEQGETKFDIIEELSVGKPGAGRESSFGEGDSTSIQMLAYTYDDGLTSYTDITDEAKSKEGSTFAFPGLDTNDALYISITSKLEDDSDWVKFLNIKVNVTTALSGGEIVAEYWDGSSWTEFNHMSTISGGKYLSYAKAIFERTGNEQIRFDKDIISDWTKNDPVSYGTDLYWIRFRVSSALSTAPEFESIKIGTNRTEVNEDGFLEFFGAARPTEYISFEAGDFHPASNSPGNQDIYLSDNLDAGRIENSFASGVTDRSTLVVPLPQYIDTSCKIKCNAAFMSDTAGGDFDINVYWASSTTGSSVYTSAGAAPSTAVGEQTLSQTVANPGSNEQFSISFDLDVSDFIAKKASGEADFIWLAIEREGAADANGGDLNLIQLNCEYIKWNVGGHV